MIGWTRKGIAILRTLSLLACVLLSSPATAVSILPLVEGRIVEVMLVGQPTETATPSPDFSDFEASIYYPGPGGASQRSQIRARSLSGSGDDFTDGAGDSSGLSRFDLVFSVDQSASFSWDGELFGEMQHFTVDLRGPSGTIAAPPLTQGAFSESGLLQAGIEYRLIVESLHPSGEGAVGPNEWTFSFVVTPEPGTGALLGLGLAALGAARRGR